MKTIIKIFIWISMIFNGAVSIFILLTFWGPLYLAIKRGEKYYWTGLIEMFLESLIIFVISFIIYKYITKTRSNIPKKNIVFFIILIVLVILLPVIFLYLSNIIYPPRFHIDFSFNMIIFNYNNIFILGLLLILIFYPKLIKKYFLKN